MDRLYRVADGEAAVTSVTYDVTAPCDEVLVIASSPEAAIAAGERYDRGEVAPAVQEFCGWLVVAIRAMQEGA